MRLTTLSDLIKYADFYKAYIWTHSGIEFENLSQMVKLTRQEFNEFLDELGQISYLSAILLEHISEPTKSEINISGVKFTIIITEA